MAKFLVSKYERDDDTIAPIKIKLETITAINTVPAGNRTGEFARAGGSTRRYGTVARQVTLSRPIGDGSLYGGGTVSVTIPILSKAVYAAISDGSTFAYNGKTDWVVAGQRGEARK